MTVPISDRLSQLYVGNGTNTRFDFTFRIFQQEDLTGVAIRKKGNTDFETVDPSTYTVTLNADDMGGFVTFNTAPSKGTYFYIAGATPLDQLLDITNYDNFYPDAIERALDKLTALLQEWGTQLDLEKQARILADIHYDSLAMEREENLENRLISYINAVVGITNPKIFDGISDRMVITKDGRTQREFNESIPFWTDDYVNFKQQTIQRERKIIEHTDLEISKTNVSLSNKIQQEKERAEAVEQDLRLQISTSNAGIKYFTSEAQLLAFTPSESDPKQAYAFDTKKNYMWVLKSGSTTQYEWKDEGLSALALANNYTDEQIKKIGFKPGVNIFDKTKVEHDKYYNYQNGLIGDAVGFLAAGLYEIKPNTEYQVPPEHGQQMAFFDSDGKYISGLESAGPTKKFTTPAAAKYIGITVEQDIVDIMMLCESAHYPSSYVPYQIYLDDLHINPDQINDFQKSLDSVLKPYDPYDLNIVINAPVKKGYYIDWQSGQMGPVPSYNVVGPCKVLPNTTYRVSANYSQQFVFLDENKRYISGQENVSATKTFTTPANAKYASFTVPDSVLNALIIAESDLFENASLEPLSGLRNLRLKSEQVSGLNSFLADELGLRPLNLIDLSKLVQDKYVDYMSGGLADNPDFVAAGPYEIKPNTEYQTSSFYYQQFAFYSPEMTYISGLPTPSNTKKFTTPANAKYVRFSVNKSIINELVVAESSVFPSGYVSSEIKLAENIIADSLAKGAKTTEIWVSADENDADVNVKFKGKNAIQLALDSITNASADNRYIIRVKKGIYKITKATEFLGYRGYPAMILTKDHVDIIGQGEDNTIVSAELPYNDEDIGPSIDGNTYPRNQYQTVYNYSDDSEMKDITFIAKNLRYTIHIDNPNGANKTRKFTNVGFLFKGNRGSLTAMGCGTSTGEKTYIVGGRSLSDQNVPFASHNNIQFQTPSFWSFKSHNFTALANKFFAYMQSDGSLLQDQLELIGCSFGGMSYQLGYVEVWLTGNTSLNRDSFYHAEWKVTGYGNEPFLFANLVSGRSLRFKTNSVGSGTNIRFDKASSAYGLLIKNNQSNSDAALYHDSREFIDGYIVQDGSPGLAAQAWGCRDLYEGVYLYDNNINYTRMGVRLGDCTVNNKTLGVIVNGTLNTIVFNKNYGPMMNSEIIAEMNSQLTGATVELISYGRDYYPTITDVAEQVYNNTASYIPKGSVVTKPNGYVRLAGPNDKIYGVALDDIPVMSVTSEGVKKGSGRVMKRGYISTNTGDAFYVLSDNQNPAIGTHFSVNNGQLVTDVNGKVSVDIDVAAVSINC